VGEPASFCYSEGDMSILSPLFKWWVNAWPHRTHIRRQVPRFLRSCPEPFRGEVLELGAGRGDTSQKILETFPQVELTAIDIDPDSAAYFSGLQHKYGRRLKVRQANMFQLPFDRDAFDIVIGINVFPHVKPFSLRKAIEESLRVLRPGGLLGISDKALMKPSHNITRDAIAEILEQEDCEILHSSGSSRYELWARKPYPVPPPQG